MLNVALHCVQCCDLGLIDIVSNTLEAGIGESADEREADVAEPHDTDFRRFLVNFVLKISKRRGGRTLIHGFSTQQEKILLL